MDRPDLSVVPQPQLAGPLNPPAGREPFEINSLSRAAFALECIHWSEKRKAEHESIAAEQRRPHEEAIRRIETQTAEALRLEDQSTAWLRAQLDRFVAMSRPIILGERNTKKSRPLAFGILGFKTRRRALVIEDEAAALAWARTRPPEAGLIRFKPQINRDALKEYAERGRLIPPGCTVVEESEEPYWKLTDGETAPG